MNATGNFRRVFGLLLVGIWGAGWSVALSYGYSSSFFAFDLCSRLPVFLTALFAACAIPLSAWWQWRKGRAVISACVRHLAAATLALVPFALSFVLLTRVSGECRISGDDAMGAGIDFMALIVLELLCLILLAGASVAFSRPGKSPASR